ncbi:LLM class flavin-dependent oxidoreductase [Deinococcus hopiensis]|uniref:Luciferase family oxidoreductase, group 1 n=1 Tax=Deinococcus hopiensis KR-140 TaxID=695939 RepID=A0A1W1UQI9_9DEIO|nr:LLM class flavin-dependent oxidoreductase [Deinococcus hopiensis]SMB83303.1 luciferase family oxidoreductase, group 1 [Deinococcus hopiensis KR-140]
MSLTLSVLDVSPVPEGGTGADAVRQTLEYADLAEALGYARFWLAEHHNMPGFAGVAPEVLIGVIAARTRRIRVGSGGVLLPNYAPLKVAEVFRTLEALTPGRIDLGIGRAPKMDPRSALALRGSEDRLRAADDIGRQVEELEGYAEVAPSPFAPDHPLFDVRASPEGAPLPPVWLLGSGQLSAGIAARHGRGFAAAHHFSPLESEAAVRTYREHFVPSVAFPFPYAVATVSVIAADTAELAEGLARASQLAFLRRLNGERRPAPTVEEARAHTFTPEEEEKLRPFAPLHGTPDRVRAELTALARRLNVNELMVSTVVADVARRRRSLELIADALGLLGRRQALAAL